MANGFRSFIAEVIAREARPVDKYGHQPRLYALTRKIGEEFTYDDDIVFAAAWLHDIGVFVGNRPEDPELLRKWDHVGYACERTLLILSEAAFPVHKVPAVLDAIRTHQPKDDPQTIEAVILRDADILEQLGAIGLLRTISKVGRDTRYARFSDVLPVMRGALADLPPKLRTERAKQLAAPKVRLLAEFVEAADREAGDALF
jgi:uncharacterized protein